MPTGAFAVDGPACGTCLAELLERVREIDGVDSVAADLSPDGATLVVVESTAGVSDEHMHGAIEGAGFTVVPVGRARARRRGGARLLAAGAASQPQGNEIRRGGTRKMRRGGVRS